MGFLQKIVNRTGFTLNDPGAEEFFRSIGLDTNNISSSSELSEVVYFTCLKHLSETQSKMPWEKRKITQKKGKEKIVDNNIDILLNIRPNEYYSASTFWGCIELNKLHYGNAYAYIETNKGEPCKLWILPSKEVSIWIDNAGIFGNTNSIWYVWTDSNTGKQWTFSQDEILHFKTGMSLNGLVGMATKDILQAQIQSRLNADNFLKKLYENNMFGSKILIHYTGDINKKGEDALAEKLENFSAKRGSGKFIPLPLGMQAQLMDMKLSDAQFFENNKFSALQIAAAFGVKPNVINNYEKSSYSNSETQQLDFYVNTLHPSFNSYEQEVTYKLTSKGQIKNGMRLHINERVLFKMDSKTQAEVYSSYIQNFLMSPNEAREELNQPYKEGADDLIGNGNYIKLNQVGNQWKKGGSE
ncbi:phage portal protein [Tepidibacter mesophilus]|uniref:phage portal protein n=1 Tax=Tepidibacter mesophilus TaxID=655607 RepID=UPI000C06F3DA|nr:phage portal protein [Tepidibacter mesophilus]